MRASCVVTSGPRRRTRRWGCGSPRRSARRSSRLGLPDGGVRALTIAILRETRMPAVQVEMGVAASAGDAARMRGDAFASDVATAVADGLERFLGATVPARSRSRLLTPLCAANRPSAVSRVAAPRHEHPRTTPSPSALRRGGSPRARGAARSYRSHTRDERSRDALVPDARGPRWRDLGPVARRSPRPASALGAEGIFTLRRLRRGRAAILAAPPTRGRCSRRSRRRTERLRLGTMVSPVTFRLPGVLTKIVTTVDHVSRGRDPRIVIFGAVEFAAHLSAFAQIAGWRPYVIDPRARFATPERFPDALGVVAGWPEAAFEQLGPPDPRRTSSILTHDPKLDDAALLIALRSEAPYIGAMGSKRAQTDRRERLLRRRLRRGDRTYQRSGRARPRRERRARDGAVDHGRVVAVRYGRDGGRLSRRAPTQGIHSAAAKALRVGDGRDRHSGLLRGPGAGGPTGGCLLEDLVEDASARERGLRPGRAAPGPARASPRAPRLRRHIADPAARDPELGRRASRCSTSPTKPSSCWFVAASESSPARAAR